MDRRRFQELSRIRLDEAKALLESELSDGAFYLAGYAVECALKACIAKNTRARYERKTLREAQELYKAITEPHNGVLPWLQQNW